MLRIASSPEGGALGINQAHCKNKHQNKNVSNRPILWLSFLKGLFFMLEFFSRTLTRREMALGCAVLSLALLLSALPAALCWEQAQLDTGAILCADTLRFHIRADSDSPADQTAKLAVRDAILAYADVHCTAQDKPAALRWAAESLPALELTARAVLARRGIFPPLR